MTMRITESQLRRIVRQELSHLTETSTRRAGYLFEDEDVFGQSFNDPDKRKSFRVSDPPERNTAEEQKFVNKLKKWFNGHLVASSLNSFASDVTELMPVIRSGIYPELTPPPGKVYRGMKLTPDQLKSFLDLEEFTIKAGKYKVIDKGGVLSPQRIKFYKQGKPISSWSTSASVAARFANESENPSVDEATLMSVVLVADTGDSSNMFFLNPDNLARSYSKQMSNYSNEKEVIAVGPVRFNSVIVYSDRDVVESGSPESEKMEFLDAAFRDIISRIDDAIQDRKTELSQAASKLGLKKPSDGRKIKHIGKDRAYVSIATAAANGISDIIKSAAAEYGIKKLGHPGGIKQQLFFLHDFRASGDYRDLSSTDNIAKFLGEVIREIIGLKKAYAPRLQTLAKKASAKR
jgi:hypothetical protein